MIAPRVSVPFLVMFLATLGCGGGSGQTDASGSAADTATESSTGAEAKYHATIRRTAYGVAHILAEDLGSAGFGQAYAFAQDHACVLADQILKVRSERSLFHGPGEFGEHLDSDFGYLALDVMKRAEAGLELQSPKVRALIDGYVAGYNQFLADTGTDKVVGSCGGQPWLRPISSVDLFAYYVDLGLLGSSNALLNYLATAQPPGSALVRPGGPVSGLRGGKATGIGSNGWAIGKARSASGAGMVVANPHFPWEGELKLWESHVTVPGELNVYGVGLMGVPGVLIGFNEHIGWTHTFSDGQRFSIYALELVKGDPTSYLYNGQPRKMTVQHHRVRVKQADGTEKDVSRTMYSSHYGPILNVDPFGWSNDLALTYRDANIDNTSLIEQFFGMNLASSLTEFKRVYQDVGGIPWVNTMAADAEGHAWYIDASATPRLSQAAIDGWLKAVEDGDFLAGVLYEQGLVVLDGGDPTNEWVDAPGARPGIVPYAELPQIDREDFVFNANDSHWLSNPAAPLEGYSPLHGFERVPQSPRTRMNIRLLADQGAGTAAGADGKFTVSELQAAMMGNRSMTGELLLDAVVERCDGVGKVTVVDVEVDISEACATLAGWDGRFDVGSVGAVLWREFLGSYNLASAKDRGPLFEVPFDADDPVATPNTLAAAPAMGEPDKVLEGLGKAVQRLAEAGVPVDATLGAVQGAPRSGKRFAVPGGQARDGTANQVSYGSLKTTLDPATPRGEVVSDATGLTKDGQYVVNYGSSFVMAMEFGEKGPRGSAFLTYSESDDPASPHYSDQTVLFSTQRWRPIVFAEADIAADPTLRTLEVAGGE